MLKLKIDYVTLACETKTGRRTRSLVFISFTISSPLCRFWSFSIVSHMAKPESEETKKSVPGGLSDETHQAIEFRRSAHQLALELRKAESAAPISGLAQINMTQIFTILALNETHPLARSLTNRYAAFTHFTHYMAAERKAYGDAQEATAKNSDAATASPQDQLTWYKCHNPICAKLVPTAADMKSCTRCNAVYYCCEKCRRKDRDQHNNKDCVGTFDYELYNLLEQIQEDLDTWRKFILQATDLKKVGLGPVQEKESEIKYVRWVMPLPLIFRIGAAAQTDGEEFEHTVQAIKGKRNSDVSTQFIIMLISHMSRGLLRFGKNEGVPMVQRTHQLAQMIVTPKQGGKDHAVMRCCCCLGPSDCLASFFLEGRHAGGQSLRVIVSGEVGCAEADGSIAGHVWWTCSPDCALFYRVAVMPHILFTAHYDRKQGEIRMTTDLVTGLKGFFEVASDKVEIVPQTEAEPLGTPEPSA
jgi:hypothetical protein